MKTISVLSAFVKKHALLLLALFTALSLQLNLEYTEQADFFKAYSLLCLFLFPVLYFCYKSIDTRIRGTSLRFHLSVIIPAILFAVFMVIGYSFAQTDSLQLIKGMRNGQMIKACLKTAGYAVVFYFAIAFLFYEMDSIGNWTFSNYSFKGFRLLKQYASLLKRCPFRTTFVTLMAAYVPYIVISYPANIMGDAYAQMLQAYPELGIVTPAYLSGRLLSDSVYLSSHHPIVHTLLLHGFLQLGNLVFHSFNIGIFLLALCQFLFMLAAVSYAVRLIVTEISLPIRYVIPVIFYYIVSPRIQSYMFLITKDVIYSIFLLYFICALYLAIQKRDRKYTVFLILSELGMILFRNEARYILILSLPIIALLNKERKRLFLKNWFFVILFSLLFFRLFLPFCNVNPGSIREMLSVPFQQTARCVRDHPDEITNAEKEAIAAVLDYSALAENYFPDRSDAVKDTFHESCDRKELLNYFKVWFQMFLKYPGSYLQASINNYYYYFYPGEKLFDDFSYEGSALCMEIMNDKMQPLGANFHYPSQLDHVRGLYSVLREKLGATPFLSFLMAPATYTWFLILLLCYGIYKKRAFSLSILTVPFVLVLVCLLGPCNGFYGRYLYPVLVVFPVMLCFYFGGQRVK